jgi:hypothetical protein
LSLVLTIRDGALRQAGFAAKIADQAPEMVVEFIMPRWSAR